MELHDTLVHRIGDKDLPVIVDENAFGRVEAAAAEAVDHIVVPADDFADFTDKLPVFRELDDAVVARVGYPEVAPILLIKEVLRPVEAEKLIRPVEHIGFGRRYQPGAGVA